MLLAELSSSQKTVRFMYKGRGFEFYFYSVSQTINFLLTDILPRSPEVLRFFKMLPFHHCIKGFSVFYLSADVER